MLTGSFLASSRLRVVEKVRSSFPYLFRALVLG